MFEANSMKDINLSDEIAEYIFVYTNQISNTYKELNVITITESEEIQRVKVGSLSTLKIFTLKMGTPCRG